MSTTRVRAALSGTAAAMLSTFVALFSHVAGGGAMPGALGVLVPFVLSTAICIPLALRRMTLPRLGLSVGASQFLFHTLFVLGAASGNSVGGDQHAHVHASGSVSLANASLMHGAHTGPGMWIAHLAACVLTVAAIRSAKTVLEALAALSRFITVVFGVPALYPTGLRRQKLPAFLAERAPLALGYRPSGLSLRGPPAPLLAH